MSKKSNIEYLKDICAGNEEAIEFIDAVEMEMTNLAKQAYENESDDGINYPLPEYPHTTYAGIGKIFWDTDNLALKIIMEALGEKLNSVGHAKVIQLLEVRPKMVRK